LLFTYKLIFGLIDLDVSDFFTLRCDNRNRGHQYKLFLPGSSSSVRHNFYTYRAAEMWNSADSTNFSSLNSFKRKLHHFWQDILQFMSFRFSY